VAAKIVVVDDSRTQRSTIALALERQGYRVVQGSNGLEAFQLVQSENPDLLVSDIVMPELTGYQVCRLLKNDSATEDLPIILLTTLDQQEHRFWGKEAGADSYVLKGAGTAPLEQEVARLLAEKKRKPAARVVSKGAVPFARQTAHARLTDLLDRLLFEATISNRIRETGRSNSDLIAVLKNFFEFFKSLIDYQIALLALRAPSGPVAIFHFADRVPAAWLKMARQTLVDDHLLPLRDKESARENLLNPELLTAEEPAERRNLAMLSAPFTAAVEGSLSVFTANRSLYTDETRQTLMMAARELEPILASKFQAQELEKLKADFTAMIVHDLRAPLTAIMSSAAIVEDGLVGPITADQKTWLFKISASSRNLLNLINDFLDLSKIEAGRLELIKEEVDMERLVRASLDDYVILTREKKISLTGRTEAPLSRVAADPRRLGQVFTNLISNAIKFTQVGAVRLKVQMIENNETSFITRFSVVDTGIGISKDKQEKIFERFFQNEIPGSMVNQGSGIGLAITWEFVRLHNGTIKVESAPGEGSCFTVTLPVVAAEEEVAGPVVDAPAVEGKKGKKSKKQTVLLVEDNEDFRFYLKDNLRVYFNILEAVNGKEGWQKTLGSHPDLVVSDISMPEMNGTDLCRKIKEDKRTAFIPVILLTALTGEEQQLRGLETGANDYMTKPFNFEILLSKIRNLLAQQETARKTYQKQVEASPSHPTVESSDEKFIRQALDLVEKNMANPDFSVEEMSRELFISRVALYKRLLALTGKTPIEFIRSVRLKRAAQLLGKSQHTVSEIAYEVGFNNPKYFSRYFKEEFGVLPSAWQKNEQG